MEQLIQYKCPCCGGAIDFNTEKQTMKCPYCDTEFDIEALSGYDDALKEEKQDTIAWDSETEEWKDDETGDMRVYVCNSCGGEIVTDNTTAATACPYCGNPVVMTGNLSGSLKPDLIIPFKLDRQAAKDGLSRHLADKRFLPKVFRSQNHLDELKGIYVPFWLFDADVDANIRYRTTRTDTRTHGNKRITTTQYYTVLRSGTVTYKNVPVDGAKKIDDTLMESIEPFDANEAVTFQTPYLAGFCADRFDVSADDTINRANARIKKTTEDAFASSVNGYSSVSVEASGITVHNGKAKYALYPVWLLNTTWNGRKYTFAMNGQTGKFVGDLPCDRGLYWKYFFGIAAAVAAGVFLLSYLLYIL